MERNNMDIMRKLLALALALTVAVTFIPLLGDSAFAAEGDNQSVDPNAAATDTIDPTDPNQVDISLDELAGGEGEDAVDITNDDEPVVGEGFSDENAADLDASNESGAAEGSFVDDGNILNLGALAQDSTRAAKAITIPEPGISASHNYYTGNISQNGNTVSINASVQQSLFRFDGLYVDGSLVRNVTSNSINTTINMSNYNTGYHTVCLYVACTGTGKFYDRNNKQTSSTAGTRVELLGWRYITSNNITDTPNYNGKFYYVYSNYFNYYPFALNGNLSGGKLYMEYSTNGWKTWSRTGSMTANMIQLYTDQGFKISGLAANRNYQTRIRYGDFYTYSTANLGDGKSYFFGGPVRNTGTIKTGQSSRPAIKSVKAKAVKVKRHKNKVAGHYEWAGNYLIWIKPYTEKYYTYKIKITVKLKKKPGTNGIWINGKFAKGNKKKYTVTYAPYPNYSAKKPRGKKISIQIKSFQNTGYGGYSPVYSTKKKLK